ncbi:MAG: hypothetical protein KAU02_03045 [Tenericutes bacterium]|nr:hypothetical protein [Mycoplasmatota bacterium]
MLEIRGIGISGKKGTGIAFKYERKFDEYRRHKRVDLEQEKIKYSKIKEIAKHQIHELYKKAILDSVDTAEIFKSHELLVVDSEIEKYIHDLLNQGYDLLSALIRTKEDMKTHFLNMKSEIFRSKVSDIDDVFERLMSIEEGDTNRNAFPSTPFILICNDIIPSLIYQIPKEKLKGIITRFGSNCSHGAILARTRNIPVIIRLKNRINNINNDDRIIMNGESGTLFVFND